MDQPSHAFDLDSVVFANSFCIDTTEGNQLLGTLEDDAFDLFELPAAAHRGYLAQHGQWHEFCVCAFDHHNDPLGDMAIWEC